MDNEILAFINICFDKSPEEAIAFLKSKGIAITWDWEKQLEAIKQHCFTVAKVTSADLLQEFKDELVKALTDGETYDDFKKRMAEILDSRGYTKREDGSAWRLDTIYRTNLQSAYMAGRYSEMKDVEQDFPYWQYIAVMDIRTRPSHAMLNGKVIRADDPFWQTCYVPNGYNCRCRTRALDSSDLLRLGLKVVSGKSLKFKPDEGFATSPTEQFKPDFNKYATDIRKQLQKVLA